MTIQLSEKHDYRPCCQRIFSGLLDFFTFHLPGRYLNHNHHTQPLGRLLRPQLGIHEAPKPLGIVETSFDITARVTNFPRHVLHKVKRWTSTQTLS